MTETTPTN